MKNFNIQLFATDDTIINIYSNDGETLLYNNPDFEVSMDQVTDFTVTSTGLEFRGTELFTYTGNKIFIGFATSINQTTPVYGIGDGIGFFDVSPLYIVEMVKYKKILKDGDKVQVDSAIRDGNGVKIDTNYEKLANKVTSISNSSTDTQYPSAKCVYDELGNKVSDVKLGTTSIVSSSVATIPVTTLNTKNIDNTPTQNSQALITSGGVYTAIQNSLGDVATLLASI